MNTVLSQPLNLSRQRPGSKTCFEVVEMGATGCYNIPIMVLLKWNKTECTLSIQFLGMKPKIQIF
jgi:hypothetical protein